MIEPKPTKTFVIDLGRKCNLEGCKFCYYKQLGDLRKQGWESYDKLIKCIDDGYKRGNDYYEVTGAEPSIYPKITDLIEYALDKYNLKGSMITNAIAGKNAFQKIIDAGINEFLISIHGTKNIHNYCVGLNDAFERQERTLKQIMDNNKPIRFNCVINKFNQEDLYELSNYMLKWKPIVVNFINMNLHHKWKDDTHTAKDVVSNLRTAEPLLNKAIKNLETNGVKINVRYYPMCRIDKSYRKYISNDLQVMFQSFNGKIDIQKEWDYCTTPKTVERYYEWGKVTSNNNEEKSEPCCKCDLQWVCGGANKHWHSVTNSVYGEQLDSQIVPEVRTLSPVDKMWYYRKYNL
jgi:MoaA/NifB/PqqE/SkfB family radical SAM enzyme